MEFNLSEYETVNGFYPGSKVKEFVRLRDELLKETVIPEYLREKLDKLAGDKLNGI